ncbi:GLPGLI family protein [Mucilaginibacter aquariorum]|uniref:GLPGLI family protein n=1 Tax=Mucilaginibacter aquariorum TaxID=2967225 RepID=A0ABT1T347_9SPHI|nr:GLPGLI family protein [Mucilaginibacter aquariorum]MCQ6958992.1 GLPGLI family protein [Mucilaginibacter aquariorum]
MKRLLLSFAFLLLLTINSVAQKADVAIGKATYEFIHVRDTANRDKPYKETMALILGRNASAYRSITKQQQEEMLANQIANQVKSATDPNHLNLTITGSGVVSSEEYYQYTNDKKLYTEEQIVNYYLVEEPLPVIKWIILKDTLSIGALHCQKATGHFKGRDYEAWFCTDLPFHAGPWKLNGLPGLIIEAWDTKKEVIFKFNSFEDISNLNQTISPPVDDIKTTPQDLARLKEARAKDPAGFNKASRGGSTGKRRGIATAMDNIDPSKISSINVVKATDSNSKVNNNPIELPEKK